MASVSNEIWCLISIAVNEETHTKGKELSQSLITLEATVGNGTIF